MVVFDEQIYFAQMEWGDLSKKQWFKLAQPTILFNEIYYTYCASDIPKQFKVKSVFSSSFVKATGPLGLFPFLCFFSCFCVD